MNSNPSGRTASKPPARGALAFVLLVLALASMAPPVATAGTTRTYVDYAVRPSGTAGIYDPDDPARACLLLTGIGTGPPDYYRMLRTWPNLPSGGTAPTPAVTVPDRSNCGGGGMVVGAGAWRATFGLELRVDVTIPDPFIPNPGTATWRLAACVKEGSVLPASTGVGASAFFPNSCPRVIDASAFLRPGGTGLSSAPVPVQSVAGPGQSAVVVSCTRATLLDTNTFQTRPHAAHDWFTVYAAGNTAYLQWGMDPDHLPVDTADNGCPSGL